MHGVDARVKPKHWETGQLLSNRLARLQGDLAPHDLQRTHAQLGYEAGIPITRISILLGHASVEMTQWYLNLDLDLHVTVSDFIRSEMAGVETTQVYTKVVYRIRENPTKYLEDLMG